MPHAGTANMTTLFPIDAAVISSVTRVAVLFTGATGFNPKGDAVKRVCAGVLRDAAAAKAGLPIQPWQQLAQRQVCRGMPARHAAFAKWLPQTN